MATDRIGNAARHPAGAVLAPCKGLGWGGLVEIFGGKGLTYNELVLGTVLWASANNFTDPHKSSSRRTMVSPVNRWGN